MNSLKPISKLATNLLLQQGCLGMMCKKGEKSPLIMLGWECVLLSCPDAIPTGAGAARSIAEPATGYHHLYRGSDPVHVFLCAACVFVWFVQRVCALAVVVQLTPLL